MQLLERGAAPVHQSADLRFFDFVLAAELAGDVKIELWDYDKYSRDDKMCSAWFNVGYELKPA
eukprot:SAG22_NODE_6305_length_872_cov_1.398448_1_plen_62_part_10